MKQVDFTHNESFRHANAFLAQIAMHFLEEGSSK